MFGYIYKVTNLTNNKIYIGQHKSTEFDSSYLGSGVNIQKAIKKYGNESFNVELLEWCDTQQLANEREIYYIEHYHSREPSIGYNIAYGGQDRFFTGCQHTDESRKKMSERAKNRPHPPTTAGRVWYTNGKENKTIISDDIEYYESIGWHKGRTFNDGHKAWNKGLTKETDARVKKYTEKRNEIFKECGSIGCFGIEGNTNGFVKGNIPWNKGLKGYNNGHPNYYHGKHKD